MEPWDWSPYLASDDETADVAFARWYDAGLGDGLPIVPPTPARVRRLYRRAGMDPARQLAELEPAMRTVSVFDVAVCATAAGCAPEHLPVVAAAVRAVAEPSFNLLGIQTTTGSATPVIIAHGPAALAAGVSGGGDCLGGSAHANAAIGRALRLVLRTVGGARPGGMDAATMGQPAKIGLCFAENHEASPWPPLHTDRGLRADESAVTVVGISGSIEVVQTETADAEDVIGTLAGSTLIAGNLGGRGLLGGGSPLVVLSPEHAAMLHAAGLTRRDAQRRLWERAVLPLERLNPSQEERIRRGRRDAGLDDVDAPLRLAERPEEILIAVAGSSGVKSTYMPSWGGGTRAATVRV